MQCAPGVFARAGAVVARLGETTGIYVLSSPRVWEHWGRPLIRALGKGKRTSVPVRAMLFDDSEAAKDLATIEQITRQLVLAGADRKATIVAMGGGVVGDVAGFAAASYLRGVRLVHVPTTLVAQVDSSIGGKTGVNLPEGKNLVGAFYPPKLVIADPKVLLTLPHREYRSGLYEVVKYGIIADPELFAFLERHMLALLRRDAKALAWVITRCIRIKARRRRARRTRRRPAPHSEFRTHAGTRAGSRHALSPLPARRSDRLGHARGNVVRPRHRAVCAKAKRCA